MAMSLASHGLGASALLDGPLRSTVGPWAARRSNGSSAKVPQNTTAGFKLFARTLGGQ